LDIAPTTLYTLDLPIAEELQGRVPEEIYQDTVFKTHPIRRLAAGASAAGRPAGNTPIPAEMEDEEIVLERLRELGYIE
jgi:hypothetical protein